MMSYSERLRAHEDLCDRVRAALPQYEYVLDRLDDVGSGRVRFSRPLPIAAATARAVRARATLIQAGLLASVEHRVTVRVELSPEMLTSMAGGSETWDPSVGLAR